MEIEDKLEEARLRGARRRMQIIIAVLATVCLIGFLMFGLSLLDFSAKDQSKVIPSTNTNVTTDDIETLRSKFKERLQQYENDLEPRLNDGEVEVWNRDGLFEITELQKKMMQHFSSGEYDEALQNLELIEEKTAEILAEGQRIFNENLTKATSYLADDLYDEAKLHIEKALVVAPESEEALIVRKEIEKLPLILPLLNEAKVARTENDLQKEYNFLQQVADIEPGREEVAERLQVLDELIKNQKFETHISAGFAAINNKQAAAARGHYQSAREVDPARQELALFKAQLAELERSLRVQKHIKEAEQAIRRDDWREARDNLAKAAKDAPGDKTVVEGLRQADRIIGILNDFKGFFNNPYRLASQNVRTEAETSLDQAESFANTSFAVKRQSEQLRELINRVNRLVPVTIVSDNQTYIQVRGIGKVGMVSERTIELKPGTYTFEGSRPGFKSKLVETLIPYDQNNFSVRIVCDERI
ncbi:MAG: hypothetical protein QNJ17_05100 [Desulfocapsaceae bacterium]|nr:hypothetical protein [Desulfocapsaceae bacterium]